MPGLSQDLKARHFESDWKLLIGPLSVGSLSMTALEFVPVRLSLNTSVD